MCRDVAHCGSSSSRIQMVFALRSLVLNAASLTLTVPSSVATMVRIASFGARLSMFGVVLISYWIDVRREKNE